MLTLTQTAINKDIVCQIKKDEKKIRSRGSNLKINKDIEILLMHT
jgi:hypothetical protein